jgi:hypothetical protein
MQSQKSLIVSLPNEDHRRLTDYGFQFAMAQKPLNGTTSISIDAWVPRKSLTVPAELVGRVGIELIKRLPRRKSK